MLQEKNILGNRLQILSPTVHPDGLFDLLPTSENIYLGRGGVWGKGLEDKCRVFFFLEQFRATEKLGGLLIIIDIL